MRLSAFFIAAFIAAAPSLATARSVPIIQPKNIALATGSGKPLTTEQFFQALRSAPGRRGWIFTAAGPGKMTGTLSSRRHSATIEIAMQGQTYSITYKSSTSLDYEKADGVEKINSTYNRWIEIMMKDIQAEAARY